jgi:hypothetical protein
VRTVRATYSTMGQQNPAMVTLSGGYEWRGTPRWNPGAAAPPEAGRKLSPANPRSNEARKLRFAAYCEVMEAGGAIEEGAEAAGIAVQTAMRYERERKALAKDREQQQGATR